MAFPRTPCLYSSSCQERLMETKDLLTGLATILLAGVPYLLFHATNVMARSATEDSRVRKELATIDAWMQLRSEISSETLPDLTPVSSKTERDKARPILGRLEAFAACINSCAYDFDTFYKISGSWFHWRYQKMQSYIEDPEKNKNNLIDGKSWQSSRNELTLSVLEPASNRPCTISAYCKHSRIFSHRASVTR
jgi:hypothetical protein